MQLIDYIILFAYFTATLLVGAVTSRKQKLNSDFFLAGRSMHWFPIGISIMVTAFSAINYVAFSGEVFSHGLYVLMCLPVFAIISIPITRVIMPFYHRMGLYSAYEYLEKRFDVRVRCLASVIFLIWRIFWMATLLYVPSVVLSRITGLDVYGLILLTGTVATAYSAAGGIKAGMWSDMLQFFVLLSGLLVGIGITFSQTPGGVSGALRLCAADGLMKPFYPFDPKILSFDPHIRISLWSAIIGTFTAFMARYGVDQTVVQRYFTAKSLKNAQTGFRLNYITAIVSLLLLALMGFGIHVFASNTDVLGKLGTQPVAYFTAFVESLPAGVTGLIVAGLLSASMSSVDSGINSCCTVFIMDFYKRFSKENTSADLTFSRLITLGFGTLATGFAMNISQLGSIFEIANKIINGFGSPLLAIFLLGMFSRTANSRGMIAGGLLGVFWSAYVSFGVKNLALHYYAVVNLMGTLACCYLISLIGNRLTAKPSTRQISWTWHSVVRTGKDQVSA